MAELSSLVVVTISSGRLLCEMGELYKGLNYLTNDNLFTHQMPRAMDECGPWLHRWFHDLRDVDKKVVDLCKSGRVKEACEHVRSVFGDTIEVGRIPADDHDRIDPYDEIVQMRGTDEGIIVIDDQETEQDGCAGEDNFDG